MHRFSLTLVALSVLMVLVACGLGSHKAQAPTNPQGQSNQGQVMLPGTNETSSIAMLPADGVITSLPVLVSFMAQDGIVAKLKPSGLSGSEPWGTWSAAKEVVLQFAFANPLPTSAVISLSFHALANDKHSQRFDFLWNGKSLGSQTYTDFKDVRLSYDLSGLLRADNTLIIKVPDATTPKSLGINQDTRELGIGLTSIEFDSK